MKKIFFAMVAMLATSMVSVAQSYNYGSNSRRSTTTSTYVAMVQIQVQHLLVATHAAMVLM